MINQVLGMSITPVAFNIPTKQKNRNNNNNITVPKMLTVAKYSAENIKANYMPISFGAGGNLPAKVNKFKFNNNYDSTSNVKNVSRIPESQKYKGAYYDNFSDDTAIMLGSQKDIIFTAKKGVEPEIFAHNFMQRIKDGKYEGMGLSEDMTDVIYIDDPSKLKKDNVKPTEFLAQLQNFSKTGVVVMNNFEKFGKIVRDDISDRAGLSVTYDMKDYLSTMFPNLNIIGVVNDGLFKEPEDAIERQKDKENREKQTLLKEFANMSHIELKGLNTAQAKDFIRNNPKYLKHTLNQHLSTSMKIEDDAMSNLVEKAAIKMDMALPTSAKVALDRLTFAKVNETDLAHKDSLEPVIISSQDVDNFFDRHSVVMEEFKPKAGQFTLAENIKTKLSDVGGISSIKQEIQEDLIEYLKNPEKFTEERGTAPKGVLLEGPPGTGKTLLARAIAGESNTPFISASGSEFVEMYVGVGAKRVRELFKAARDAAENSPNHTSIVFIDEFDALARARSNEGGNREAEQTLNQLLCEMDGFNNKESKTKVVVIAATNRKDMLDKAAIRPGRFDDVFKVDNPRTEQDRLEIMNIHAKKLNFASEEEKTKILKDTAKLTDGMSGAELAGVMNRAKRIVAKRPDNKVVTYNDMVEAYLQTIAGPVQKNAPERPIEDIIETVRHEGGHATVIDCLNPLLGDKINFITLDKRGNFLGAVFRKPSEMMPNIRSVILSAAVGYAGGLAEPEFDKIGRGAGVSQDVSQATRLFRKAITEWGQGVYTPPITMVPNSHENDTQSNAFYDTLRASNQTNIAKDIALFSATASAIAAMVNNFHKGFLDEYVDNFKANAGKGGNSLSGAEFSKLRHDWVVKNGKLKAEKQMLAKIDKMLTRVMNKNKNIFQRIAMHLFKNV